MPTGSGLGSGWTIYRVSGSRWNRIGPWSTVLNMERSGARRTEADPGRRMSRPTPIGALVRFRLRVRGRDLTDAPPREERTRSVNAAAAAPTDAVRSGPA